MVTREADDERPCAITGCGIAAVGELRLDTKSADMCPIHAYISMATHGAALAEIYDQDTARELVAALRADGVTVAVFAVGDPVS